MTPTDTRVYQDQLRVAARYNVQPTPKIVEVFMYPNKSNVPEVMIDFFQFPQAIMRVIADERGIPVKVVVASDGTSKEDISTDEFGRVLSDTKPGYLPFKFAGCLYDEDTKLCHFGTRDYDPEEGRWLQRDPILFNGGDTNLYNYVVSDPVNFTDPDGKCYICVAIVGGAAAGAVGNLIGTAIAGGDRNALINAAINGAIGGAVAGATAVGGAGLLGAFIGEGVSQGLNSLNGITNVDTPIDFQNGVNQTTNPKRTCN